MHEQSQSIRSSTAPLGADAAPLAALLAGLAGRQVYFDALTGNNGDTLIELGCRKVLEDHSVRLAPSPDSAEFIAMKGGAMFDVWPLGARAIERHSQEHPGTPLIVMPTSFQFKQMDFPALLRGRTSPAYLYARERYSLDYLKSLQLPPQTQLGLDHDMAFELNDAPLMHALRAERADKHILIVERTDPEAATGATYQPIGPGIRRFVPQWVKRPIRRQIILRRARRCGAQTPFARQSLERVLSDRPEFRQLPVYVGDVSWPDVWSFRQFQRLIARAAAVISTRLHAGILAAMLGKPTYLKCGAYHKIRGIYEYSMASMEHVRLLD